MTLHDIIRKPHSRHIMLDFHTCFSADFTSGGVTGRSVEAQGLSEGFVAVHSAVRQLLSCKNHAGGAFQIKARTDVEVSFIIQSIFVVVVVVLFEICNFATFQLHQTVSAFLSVQKKKNL